MTHLEKQSDSGQILQREEGRESVIELLVENLVDTIYLLAMFQDPQVDA